MPDRVIKPMLAKEPKYTDDRKVIVDFPVIGQIKYDGIRVMVVDGVVRSRTFKPIPNREIQATLGQRRYEGFDGEIIVGQPEAEGCMQRTSSFVMAPNKTGEDWTFYAFDRWDLPGKSYLERRDALWNMELPGFVYRVSGVDLNNAEELEAFEASALAEGHEGIILRDPSGPYKHGRSGKTGPLLKVKRFIDFEAEIIGVYEEERNTNEALKDAFGRTERSTKKAGKVGKGTLGGFILRAINGPHAGQKFRCGTGFTRDQRQALWDSITVPPPLRKEFGLIDPTGEASGNAGLIGKTVKIKSFPVGVKDAPRFPVFLGFRDMEIDG